MKKLILLIGCLGVFTAAAQVNPAVNQATTTQQQRETDKMLAPGGNVPALYDAENEDVGPQSVLIKKKPTLFRVSADAQMFYTDNMFYQEHGKQDAGVAVSTIEAAFTTAPCITRLASYSAEVGYRHQFFNYFGHDDIALESIGPRGARYFDASDFDFDSSTAFANVIAQTKHYQFRAGFDYTRLLGFKPVQSDDYQEFYAEYVPRWSLQRNFRVCDKSMFSLSYLGSYHFTDEDELTVLVSPTFRLTKIPSDRNEHWEHTFIAAYTLALPHHFAAQPYYRFQYTDFVNGDDSTYLHTAGFALGWFPCQNFSVRGFVSYNWQIVSGHTGITSPGVNYEKLDGGGGVNATLRF